MKGLVLFMIRKMTIFHFMQGTTPVYNLLPEILSILSSEADLPQKGFQEIMRHLLQYIGKEKHADSLVDKLCVRFEGTREQQQWRNLAFCISQVSLFDIPGPVLSRPVCRFN